MVDAEAVGVGYGLDEREGRGCGRRVDVEAWRVEEQLVEESS
jgi:hypothetical protein